NQVILEYLGEPEPPRCGRCDNCLRSREAALAASTEATRLGARLTRELDDDQIEQPKPRREIKARVVRIDQPQVAGAAAGAAPIAGATPAVAAPAPAAPSTVLRRQKPGVMPAATPPNGTPIVAAKPAQSPAAQPAPVEAKKSVPAPAAPPPNGEEDLDDDDDDDLDDDEVEVD